MKILAKKSLGQHFLLNPNTLDKILDLAQVTSADQILEIGPGPGALTEKLASRAGRVVAVEKDHRFVEALREKLGDRENFTLIEGDILDLLGRSLEQPQCKTSPNPLLCKEGALWKVVANLPYNIATEVIFKLIDSRTLFSSLYLMVQEEVAKRLVAVPGTGEYGVLSILTQLFSKNEIVLKLPPGAFTPPPKVRSAIVAFHLTPNCRFPIRDFSVFKTVVRAAFQQRRKMVRNSLHSALTEWSPESIDQALEKACINPMARAETLSITNLVDLANELNP